MLPAGPVPSRPPAPIAGAARRGGLLAVVVFTIIASGGRPAGLVEGGPFTSDFFDAQADALLDGRLAVDPQVPGIEGFVHDGETHLYFGLVPALLRLPVAAVTDRFDGRLTQLSMVAALAVALWAAHRLLWEARVRVRGEAPVGRWEPWVTGGFVAAVGLSSPLLFLSARPLVYHEVELWGVATTLLAALALLAWWARRSGRRLAVATAAVTVALHTRASVGSGALVALGLVLGLGLLWRRAPVRQLPAMALALLVPVTTYAAVNAARFDHPFSVPFEEQVLSSFDPARQATLESTGGGLFGLEFVPTALATYLRPDGIRFQALFPWITFREHTDVIGDAVFDTVDRSASLPVVAPALVIVAAVGVVHLVRSRHRDPWLALVVGTAAGVAPTVAIAFVANRYLADLTPPLVLAAAAGAWPLASWLGAQRQLVRRAVAGGLVGLALVGAAVGTALSVQAQRLLLLPERDDRLGFVGFQYDVHEALAGGHPPRVEQVPSVQGRDGRRGDVAIQGGCEALWWHDGDRWWPLELGPSLQWRLVGDLQQGSQVLVGTDDWRVVAVVAGSSVSFAHVAGDEVERGTRTVELEDLQGEPLLVRIDPANAEAFVEVAGELLLVAWLVDVSGSPEPAPQWAVSHPGTPTCERLLGRLDR